MGHSAREDVTQLFIDSTKLASKARYKAIKRTKSQYVITSTNVTKITNSICASKSR